MKGIIQFFIDDTGENFLQVEYDATEDWSAGQGDALVIDICGISLNGEMSLKISDVKLCRPDWWAGIHEQITKQSWQQPVAVAA